MFSDAGVTLVSGDVGQAVADTGVVTGETNRATGKAAASCKTVNSAFMGASTLQHIISIHSRHVTSLRHKATLQIGKNCFTKTSKDLIASYADIQSRCRSRSDSLGIGCSLAASRQAGSYTVHQMACSRHPRFRWHHRYMLQTDATRY